LATAQTRVPVFEVLVGQFVYREVSWVPVIGKTTADSETTILTEGHFDPLRFGNDDHVEVCMPLHDLVM
jgi:hypothetical protein